MSIQLFYLVMLLLVVFSALVHWHAKKTYVPLILGGYKPLLWDSFFGTLFLAVVTIGLVTSRPDLHAGRLAGVCGFAVIVLVLANMDYKLWYALKHLITRRNPYLELIERIKASG